MKLLIFSSLILIHLVAASSSGSGAAPKLESFEALKRDELKLKGLYEIYGKLRCVYEENEKLGLKSKNLVNLIEEVMRRPGKDIADYEIFFAGRTFTHTLAEGTLPIGVPIEIAIKSSNPNITDAIEELRRILNPSSLENISPSIVQKLAIPKYTIGLVEGYASRGSPYKCMFNYYPKTVACEGDDDQEEVDPSYIYDVIDLASKFEEFCKVDYKKKLATWRSSKTDSRFDDNETRKIWELLWNINDIGKLEQVNELKNHIENNMKINLNDLSKRKTNEASDVKLYYPIKKLEILGLQMRGAYAGKYYKDYKDCIYSQSATDTFVCLSFSVDPESLKDYETQVFFSNDVTLTEIDQPRLLDTIMDYYISRIMMIEDQSQKIKFLKLYNTYYRIARASNFSISNSDVSDLLLNGKSLGIENLNDPSIAKDVLDLLLRSSNIISRQLLAANIKSNYRDSLISFIREPTENNMMLLRGLLNRTGISLDLSISEAQSGKSMAELNGHNNFSSGTLPPSVEEGGRGLKELPQSETHIPTILQTFSQSKSEAIQTKKDEQISTAYWISFGFLSVLSLLSIGSIPLAIYYPKLRS